MTESSALPSGLAWQDPSRVLAERVEALIADMTLEEKVGQLGSFWPRDSRVGGDVAPMEHELAGGSRPFDEVVAHGLGHLTRVFGSAPMTVPDGVAAMREMQARVRAASRHRIPAIAHEECLTGFTTLGATVYPAPLAWGATFDPGLIGAMAEAIGRDMSAVGVHQGLAPVLDVVHDYRWGRVEETIGEDPYLVAVIGTAYVRGLQRAGILATVKHFAGYSASLAARNHAPVHMGERHVQDVLLPPFEMAVREGAVASVMNSYSDLDGVPPAANRELLTTLLREEWGFTGTVVSDYWAISFLELSHRIAEGPGEAAQLALTAGLDVELPETNAFWHVPELVRSGALDETVVDTAVRRLLLQKAERGLLDHGWEPAGHDDVDLDSASNRALAASVAERSVVLLANDAVLPLAASPCRIAVVGPSAREPRTLMGCYSFPNHVLSRFEDHGTGVDVATVLEALQEEFPGCEITYAQGCPILAEDSSGIPDAVMAAAGADLAIVTVGDLAGLFGRGTSGEGCDAEDLNLPGVQAELVEAVLDTGTPVILVVNSGRPYALGAFVHRAAAILQAFFPGEEGSQAIAGVISGRVNPSGHLPVGVPRIAGGQPGTYLSPPLGRRNDGISNLDPEALFPFGHGLSYTTFELSALTLTDDEIAPDGSLGVEVTVRNTGERAGADVVQLYLTDHVAQVVRPVRQLVGFARVDLEPREACRVTFELHADRTSFTGIDHRRIVEPGRFTLAVGHSSEDLPLRQDFLISGSLRVLDGARVMTTPVRVGRE